MIILNGNGEVIFDGQTLRNVHLRDAALHGIDLAGEDLRGAALWWSD